MKAAGIVLCGGKSSRMGRSKADLPFGTETLLERLVRRLGNSVTQVVVVAATDQVVPSFATKVRVVRDERSQAGPLEGLRIGLDALRQCADRAFATSCDAPFVQSAFIERMMELASGYDVAVPVEGTFFHPLAAVYSTQLGDVIDAMLNSGQFRTSELFERVRTRKVPIEELRAVDPDLSTLVNLNHPADYVNALRRAGLEDGAS